jgi:hypothetical protein
MKSMLAKPVVCCLFVLVTFAARAQLNNSCTYSYSFGSGNTSFAFCLTPYGTLASISGASGDNLLDPVNPIEGFVMCDQSGFDLFNAVEVVPGLGLGGSPPSVSQPKGIGKLPIIFSNGLEGVTVTAVPGSKTVKFTMPFPKIDYSYEFAYGPIVRVMSLGSTSSLLSTSQSSAFAYNVPGDLLTIGGSLKAVGETETGSPGISSSPFGGYGFCGAYFQPAAPGEGFVYNALSYQTETAGVSVFSYRVF